LDWNSRRLNALIENALLEDKATRDATTLATIDPRLRASAIVIAKQDCVLAGLPCITRTLQVFEQLDPTVIGHFEVVSHPEIFDGVHLKARQVVAVIRASARVILSCERVILNLLQRLSGVATTTRLYVEAVDGTGVKILDTRKTIPGWRTLDKYAVRCGGGENHRNDLSDGILIKNNHISLGGGVKAVLAKAFAAHKSSQPIEIEVRSPAELEEALSAGAQALLVDNMTPEQVKASVQKVREFEQTLKSPRHIPVEASGGMNLENVRKFAETGVDYISVGALTHSVKAIDMSMRITPAIT